MQVMTRVHDDKYEPFGGNHAAFDPVSQPAGGRAGAARSASRAPAAWRTACATTWAPPTWPTTAATWARCWPSRTTCSAWPTAARCRSNAPIERRAKAAPTPRQHGRRAPSADARSAASRRTGGPGALTRERRWQSRPGARAATLAACATGDRVPARRRAAPEVDDHREARSSRPRRRRHQPFAWAALAPLRLHVGRPALRRPLHTLKRTAMFDRSQSTLANVDPEIWAAIQAENRRQEEHIELIASENYTSPGGDGRAGLAADQQVRRGLPRQALLRRLRVRRRGRAAGHRPRSSSCSAPSYANVQPNSGSQANQARVLRPAAARRHHHGHEPGRRRPPDPRHAAEHERQVVQGGQLRPGRQRSHRLRRDGAPGARAQAQADHRRRLGLQPAHRLRALRQGGQGHRRVLHGRHGALRRPDRRRRLPQPGAACRRGDQHHAQEPARPARRHHPDERRGRSPRRSTAPSSPASRAAR